MSTTCNNGIKPKSSTMNIKFLYDSVTVERWFGTFYYIYIIYNTLKGKMTIFRQWG